MGSSILNGKYNYYYYILFELKRFDYKIRRFMRRRHGGDFLINTLAFKTFPDPIRGAAFHMDSGKMVQFSGETQGILLRKFCGIHVSNEGICQRDLR